MLIVCQVREYGRAPSLRLFTKNVVWSGSPFEEDILVTLQFEGDFNTFEGLFQANSSNFKITGEHPRQIYCYEGEDFRKSTLEDILNSDYMFGRIVVDNFALNEYHDFLNKFFPNFIKKVGELSKTSDDSYIELSKNFEKILQRFSIILNGLQVQNSYKYREERKKGERKILENSSKLPPKELFLLAAEMETGEVKEDMVVLAFKKIFAESEDPSSTLWHILDLAKENSKLKNVLRYYHGNPNIEILIKYAFKLPQNCKDEIIEIHNMEERMVRFGPELVGAKFIGPVKIAKRALYDEEKKIFLHGTKKLKFHVLRRGGSIQKFRNTLVTRLDDVETDLLKIEKIDAYSCTNPAMISQIQNRSGKNTPIDINYVKKIENDYRVSRELADIALEELFGIDPDIARTLYRSKRGR